MGKVMARNLAKSLHSGPLLIYNRTASKAQALADEIGEHTVLVASSPEQMVTDCDVIFTSLPSDSAVKSVYEQFAAALKVLYMITCRNPIPILCIIDFQP